MTPTEEPTKELAPVEVSTKEATPTEEPTEELAPAEISMEEAAHTEEPTKETSPAVASTEETAPMEEPSEEPAAPTAMASRPTEVLDVSPVQHREKEKGEVPCSGFPDWMEVLHPSWTVIPTGQAPLTLGELRQQCCSQRVGGRRDWCQRAEECRQAMQEKYDLMSSPESPEPVPKVALPPGFKGVVVCLLRDSPSPAPIEAPPEPRQPARYVDRIHSGNSVCYPNSPGQGHWGYIHGHSNHLGEESGPQEPPHGSQPPRPTMKDITDLP